MAKPKAPTKKLRKEFFKAYVKDDVAAITAHLDAGVDPNAMMQLDWERPALATALDRNTAPNIARLLLDRGVDVNVGGPKGRTALHHVYDRAFAKEIIERGGNPNATDEWNRTPLHQACSNKLLPIVEELVAAGADVNAKDKTEATPYMLALHVGIRAHLRAHGAPGFGPGGGKIIGPPVIADGCAPADAKGDRGAIGADREGNIWIWGYTGFYRWDGSNLRKHTFEESFAVSDIVAGPPGVVYFATNWGLLKLAGGAWRLYSSEDSELFDNHITFATTSPDGRVYLLSYESEAEDKHITVFDGERFDVLVPGKDFPLGLELERIAFDRHGDLVLCGRGGLGFKQSGDWVVKRRFQEGGFDATVYDAIDDGEAVWVGTQSGVFELRGEMTTRHDTKNLAKYLLKEGETLWVGTYFGGLARIRGGEVTIFDEKSSPLPHDDVGGIVRGADGTLWVLTSNGVALVKSDAIGRFE